MVTFWSIFGTEEPRPGLLLHFVSIVIGNLS